MIIIISSFLCCLFICKETILIRISFFLEESISFLVLIFPIILFLVYKAFSSFSYTNQFFFSRRVFFSVIFLLLLRFCSNNRFFFLLFLEGCVIFIVLFIFRFAKDQDKGSSSLFMFLLNILPSLLFIYFCCFSPLPLTFRNLFINLNWRSLSVLFFLLLLVSKLPLFLFHFWLTKAHVRASGPGSMVLARLLLKIGCVGFYKFSLEFSFYLVSKFFLSLLNLRSLGFFAILILILRFCDLKFMVACSSVVHIAPTLPFLLKRDLIGIYSRFLIVVGHGVISYFIFFIVRIVYEIFHSKRIFVSKCLESKRRSLAFWIAIFFLLNIGFPPFISFLREIIFTYLFLSISYIPFVLFLCGLILRGLIFFIVTSKFLFGKKFRASSESYSVSLRVYAFIFLLLFISIFFVFQCFYSLFKTLLCGSKDSKAISLSKSFSFLFAICFCLWVSMRRLIGVSFFLCVRNLIQGLGRSSFLLSLVKDQISSTFFFIVVVVTSVVVVYSEYYIDSYNNKKFLLLTLSFLIFIIILIIRGDIIIFIIGWDGLGISSLFLIMFYPNKTRFYNSFLTLSFNRLGDIFLIFFFCLIWATNSNFFFFRLGWCRTPLFLVLFLCLLTKRAQIPFSRWLPAAMSAPTPISAIVHSSTLVTAGILVFFKIYWFLRIRVLCRVLLVISSVTFLVGGVLGCVEKDLKKIVAFSTIRQIRIILLFISVQTFSLALSHTFCHALFKTLLFCACGFIFVWHVRDQLKISSKRRLVGRRVILLLYISLFSMRGFVYSRAFLSKDCVIEQILTMGEMALFFTLIVGSVMTLIYRGRIFSRSKTINSSAQFFTRSKYFFFEFLLGFGIFSLICLKIIKSLVFNNFSFLVPASFLLLLNLFLLLALMFLCIKPNSFFLYCRRRIFHIKESIFSSFSLLARPFSENLTRNDHFFFKPNIIRLGSDTRSFSKINTLILSAALIMLMLIYSFSLSWTWYWRYQSLRIIL